MVAELHIDGSYGEGGGQLIRTALALAAVTRTDLALTNIRARRKKPGLQAQHLTAVQLAADLCTAELAGAALGSDTLHVYPGGPVIPGLYRRDIGTAGAMALVLQTALLPLALVGAPSQILLTGGSHVPFAPTIDYLEKVYLPAVQRLGIQAQLHLAQAGFYPRGGGEARLEIAPTAGLRPLELIERGALRRLTAVVTTSNLPAHVAERGVATLTRRIGVMLLARQLTVEVRELPSSGVGAVVLLAAECESGHGGFIALGAPGLPMERVAERACDDFTEWWYSGATCDAHLADQLILPLALAGGASRWTTPAVTEHLRTVIWLVEQFLPVRFTLTAQDTGNYLVQVHPSTHT